MMANQVSDGSDGGQANRTANPPDLAPDGGAAPPTTVEPWYLAPSSFQYRLASAAAGACRPRGERILFHPMCDVRCANFELRMRGGDDGPPQKLLDSLQREVRRRARDLKLRQL